MKTTKFINIKSIFLAVILMTSLAACNSQPESNAENSKAETETKASGEMTPVLLTQQQFKTLDIEADTMGKRDFHGVVEANGHLQVSPQNMASVTAIVGANVSSIKVFFGDKVKKGQILATLSHPKLLQLQTNFLNDWNRMEYMSKEFQRQKKLYKAQVGSGKDFQKVSADYFTLKGDLKNLESQLRLLHLDPEKIKQGNLYEKVPVVSPINGYVDRIDVNMGQYVEPQKTMFKIINNDRIHADLLIFEKDVYKVKIGQKVHFSVASHPDEMLTATIFAVGKSFEQNPKAVHVHASFKNRGNGLIPGMYITGRISTDNDYSYALPEAAVVKEGGKHYIFSVQKEKEGIRFTPVEVVIGQTEDGWDEIKLLSPLKPGTLFARNGAYYLISEMKKNETGEE
ncbi:MAG TPA: efflux RND transporter periplasmic adaptor subunit [Bacteroidetes bacterium]|nr:efflux RND transporter periplasmic adaptor subunit [Bacteroidota bacterium]